MRGWCRLPCASALAWLPLLASPLAAQEIAPGAPAIAPGAPAIAPGAPAIAPGAIGSTDAIAAPLASGEPRIEDFAPLPGNVPWPTVEATTAGESNEIPGDIRYSVEVKGLKELGLDDEFRSLSSLWTKRGSEANLAQVNRRIVEDRDLIDQLLRSIGHFGGSTQAVVTPPARADMPTTVSLTVDPGPLYTFSTIAVRAPNGATGPDPAALVVPLLGVSPGDAVDAATVNSAQDALALRLADAGHPFAVVGKPDIVVDHASRTATLAQSVDLGGRGVHGVIRIEGEAQGFTEAHVTRLARFEPGDNYTDAGRDDLRRALIQTGLFGTVSVKPVIGGDVDAKGVQLVDLVVTTEAAPMRTVAASGGYSTDQGIRFEASWAHRNLWPPQGGLTLRAVAAEREQAASAEFQRRNWRQRDQTLTLRAALSAEQQDAFDATTFGLTGAITRESNLLWQKPLTYSVGLQTLVTRQRDRSAPDDPNTTYFIVALPSAVTLDGSDNLLDPSRGFRLTGRVSPEFTVRGGETLGYVKMQIDATGYQPFGQFVLAGRAHVGSIAGASRGRIAPDRRFYAGGGGSVRGYNFQAVGPRDAEGAPTGGNSLVETAIEVRYRFRAFGSDLGVVGFVDGGQVYTSTVPTFRDLQFGAGLGLRYFTSFGPVRIDLATPLNPKPGDPRLSFYVSIGQAF